MTDPVEAGAVAGKEAEQEEAEREEEEETEDEKDAMGEDERVGGLAGCRDCSGAAGCCARYLGNADRSWQH